MTSLTAFDLAYPPQFNTCSFAVALIHTLCLFFCALVHEEALACIVPRGWGWGEAVKERGPWWTSK